MKNWINWFEIPAAEFDRAKKFYETIFSVELHVMDLGPLKMGVFPHNEVGGSICAGEMYEPGPAGPTLYMNANPDLNTVLEKVEGAGGKIIQAKKQISPEHGFMALFLDSEGNRIALHSES